MWKEDTMRTPPVRSPWVPESERERVVLLITGEEPDGRTHDEWGSRILWPWQASIISTLLERLEKGDPTAEAAILWLRNLWGFDDANSHAVMAEWKARLRKQAGSED